MNRRRPRDTHVLDVRVQTESRQRARWRVTGAVAGTVMFVVLTGYGLQVLGRFALRRLVFENPRFKITRVLVQNDGVLSAELVMRVAGAAEGLNIFAVDLGQAQRNLEVVPLVRRAEVRRVLPGVLIIRVEERVPVAQLRVAARGPAASELYIDRAGMVMKPLRLNDGTVLRPQTSGPLPTLTGLTLPEVAVGRRVEVEQVYRALHLLDLLAQSAAGAMVQAAQVDLSRPRELVVTTQQRSVLRFDTEDFSRQLRRLAVVLRWAQTRRKPVQMVDLTVSRSVPVTFGME